MKKRLASLLSVLLLCAWTHAQTGIRSAAYYVSPTIGLDTNSGAFASPFKTVTKCQTAMQAGFKTCYLRGNDGTYSFSAPISTTGADNGTSYQGYPNEHPVIDGGSSAAQAFYLEGGVASVTVNGLKMQNFTAGCVRLQGSGITISNNECTNVTTVTSTFNACFEANFQLGPLPTVFSHNYCHDTAGPGISINFGDTDPGFTGPLVIDGNKLLNVNTGFPDSGGAYLDDRSHTLTICSITNNTITNYGQSPYTTTNGKAVYLDDDTSNCLVQGNWISGNGEYGIQYHGGDHNVVRYNVFDLSGALKLALYQDNPPHDVGGGGMAGNTLTNNIVYSTAAPPTYLWDYIDTSLVIALPNVTSNLYYNSSSPFPNYGSQTGGIADANPTVGNPVFVGGGNYTPTASVAFSAPVSFVNGQAASAGPH